MHTSLSTSGIPCYTCYPYYSRSGRVERARHVSIPPVPLATCSRLHLHESTLATCPTWDLLHATCSLPAQVESSQQEAERVHQTNLHLQKQLQQATNSTEKVEQLKAELTIFQDSNDKLEASVEKERRRNEVRVRDASVTRPSVTRPLRVGHASVARRRSTGGTSVGRYGFVPRAAGASAVRDERRCGAE